MSMPKAGIILAAGLGLRMRPLTEDKPKAMVKVSGKPLIGHLLDRLEEADVGKIVVNVHYKPGPLLLYLEGHPLAERIIISDEAEKILETGGGVKKALRHFKGAPFFAANCDAYFPDEGDNPFLALARDWRAKDMAALLLLKETNAAAGYSGPGDFFSNAEGRLQRRGESGHASYAFTGLQILTPSLFDGIDEQVFSLNKIYDRALGQQSLFGAVYGGSWLHMGSPDMVAAAERYRP